MELTTVDPVDELQMLLQELEQLAPTREDTAGTNVAYRPVADDNLIDDSLPGEVTYEPEEDEGLLVEGEGSLGGEEVEEDESLSVEGEGLLREEEAKEEQFGPAQQEGPEISDFILSGSGPVAAIDCGIVRLGETENGLVIALRATIVVDEGANSRVQLFRTGPIYLHNHYKTLILHQIGKHLMNPDLFVELDKTDPDHPRAVRVKRGVADDSHQFGDRLRNWFERLIQRIAVESVENGIVLFDGALTLRTRDTPRAYLEHLAERAHERGNALVAISKQSLLQIGGKSIRFWLSDVPNRACYRFLTPIMRQEGVERILGNLYAARFSVLGPTLRMDVKALKGQSDDEAIGQFYSSALMRGGYPDILVRAHVCSYFTSPQVVQLQAQAGAKYRLVPQGEVSLEGIFAPFGGRFK